MHNKLTCEQILAILDYYVNGSLNKILCKLVKEHIKKCPNCMAEYLAIIEKYNTNQKFEEKTEDKYFETKQYEDFKKNLSAYIDNELDDNENIKIKKITISNQLARKDLDDMLRYKKLIYNSFEKTKNDFKRDYSKQISKRIQQELAHDNKIITPFVKITALFCIMLCFLLVSLITFLYF